MQHFSSLWKLTIPFILVTVLYFVHLNSEANFIFRCEGLI